MTDPIRTLDADAARTLRPGEDHYRAYVGPPDQFDFMGATQFRLLTALGLRDRHRVLDVGCGSLRAGRLLIPYLQPERYFGVEPNRWLVDDGIERELGRAILRIKRPRFAFRDDFRFDRFGVAFDFIVAQSIFSHSGARVTRMALANMARVLSPEGLILATFIDPHPSMPAGGDTDWVYPGCVTYDDAAIDAMAGSAGLRWRRLPWFHPRQHWVALATRDDALPRIEDFAHLSGAVLRDPAFSASITPPR